jgi:hypothetical protein
MKQTRRPAAHGHTLSKGDDKSVSFQPQGPLVQLGGRGSFGWFRGLSSAGVLERPVSMGDVLPFGIFGFGVVGQEIGMTFPE